jgi:hypothetical protein
MCRGTSYLITSFLKEVQHRARTRESSLTSRANVVKAVASVVAAGAAFAPVASPSVTRARRIFIARRLLRGARGRHRCPQVPVGPESSARNQVPGSGKLTRGDDDYCPGRPEGSRAARFHPRPSAFADDPAISPISGTNTIVVGIVWPLTLVPIISNTPLRLLSCQRSRCGCQRLRVGGTRMGLALRRLVCVISRVESGISNREARRIERTARKGCTQSDWTDGFFVVSRFSR